MPSTGPVTALGLMSGTSMDGVDAAIIVTSGEQVLEAGPWLTHPYDQAFRGRLAAALGTGGDPAMVQDLTWRHIKAVHKLLEQFGDSVDLIGFHGHTLQHDPGRGITVQIGDGALLARETGLPVVSNFRLADVAAGGQGAPLAPLYHAALASELEKPLAVLNLGGVANVTFLGEEGEIIAFDAGPGNALIDDWVRARTGQNWDEAGRLALAGDAGGFDYAGLFGDLFFRRPPPKSLDRDHFKHVLDDLAGLSAEDGAAFLTGFTAGAAALAAEWFPAKPERWLVCGGGRHNPALMAALGRALGAPAEAVETVGWLGDALEAQAFAFLAVRSVRGLPFSLPSTTGVSEPMSGGVLSKPPGAFRGGFCNSSSH